MRKRILSALRVALFVSICFSWAVGLHAQVSNGQISGYARDAQGLAVPNVQVTVTSKIGVNRTTVTNGVGYYIVADLPVGIYSVSGEIAGFKAFTLSGISLDAAAAISVDIKLEVGAVTERVNVTASAQLVTTDTSVVGSVLNTTEYLELPVSGRSFENLVGLLPGVTNTSPFNTFTPSPYGSGQWHISGSQGNANNWQMDGVSEQRTRANNFFTGTMSVDSIQEVQISTTAFKAEYGRESGGQVNFITKGGSQNFHGTLYEYDRNDSMDARGFFATTPEVLKYNDYGGNIGGPIYIPGKWNTDRSKLFFFAAWEYGDEHVGSFSIGYQAPLILRQGNFNTPYRLSSMKAPIVPPNMNLANCPGCVVGQPFPNGIIPTGAMSKNGPAMFSMEPLPTTSAYSGNNWDQEFMSRTIAEPILGRVDYDMSARNRLTVRVDETRTWDWNSNAVSVQPATQDYTRPKRNLLAQVTSSISPTLVNVFAFGATEDFNLILTNEPGLLKTSYNISFPFYFTTPKTQPNKIPSIAVSNMPTISAGASYPSHSRGPISDFRDDLSKVRGNHNFKVGIYYERAGQNDFDNVLVGGANQNGYFTFGASASNPNSSTNAMADLLLGNFDTYTEIGTRNMDPWRGRMWEGYAQDSWKVRPNFTLEIGVRVSYMPSFGSKWNNFQSFNPAFWNPSQVVTMNTNGTVVPGSGNVYNGITLPGTGFPLSAAGNVPAYGNPQVEALFHGLPWNLTQTYINPEPRFGFAWDVGGHHTTSVRGGFGIFYDRIVCNDSIHPGGVPPFMGNVSITNGSVDNPGGTSATPLQYPFVGSMIAPTAHNPESYEWSFGVERELAPNMMLNVTYVGMSGHYEPGGITWNQPQIGASYATPGVSMDYLRPYPGFTGIRNTVYAFNSNYNSLLVSVDRRLAKGLQFDATYTYQRTMDEYEGFGAADLNEYNPFLMMYGRASFNKPNVFNLSYVYQLPFLLHAHGPVSLLGGWQLSGITTFQSGLTNVTPGISPDASGAGQGGRPIWLANPNFPKSQRTLTEYFNTAAFAVPPNSTLGDTGRDVIDSPGLNNFDVALSKNFKIREGMRIQFRGEFFNVINHPQFSGLSTTVGAGNYGYVTSAQSPRIIQLGAKFVF